MLKQKTQQGLFLKKINWNWKRVKLKTILFSLLGLLVLSELSYFGYLYFTETSSINKKTEKYTALKNDNITLKKMTSSLSEINGVDRIKISRKYVKKIKKKIGAEVTHADIITKASRTGGKNTYYIVRLKYDAENKNSLLKLIAVLYLDDKITAIRALKQQYIEIVIKEERQKKSRNRGTSLKGN